MDGVAPIGRNCRIAAAGLMLFLAAGCAETQFVISGAKRLSGSADVAGAETTAGRYKVGSAYKIGDSWYYPKLDYNYSETGIASWYGPNFDGRDTANGETFDMNRISGAHRTLPLPSIVRVTNLDNGRSLKIRINDRGPFARGRIIDLSRRAAQLLGFERQGTAKVEVTILEQESRQLAAAYGVQENTSEPTAPPPAAAPRVAVTSAQLAAPPGTRTAPPPTSNHAVVAQTTAPVREVRVESPAPAVDNAVTILPVAGDQQIYVQAGSFTRYDYANRLRASLSPIGQAQIYQVKLVEQPFFRVRFGPLSTVEEADRMLASVVQAGHLDAQIVVD